MASEGLTDAELEQSSSLAAQTQVSEPKDLTREDSKRRGHIVWAADAGRGQSLRIPPPLAQEKGMTTMARCEGRKLTILNRRQTLLCPT